MSLKYDRSDGMITLYNDVCNCFVNKVRIVYRGRVNITHDEICKNFESFFNYKGAYSSIIERARTVKGTPADTLTIDISPTKLRLALGGPSVVIR